MVAELELDDGIASWQQVRTLWWDTTSTEFFFEKLAVRIVPS